MMNQYAPCPKCGGVNSERMSFTWWGGILGPRILTHVKCGNCAAAYNGKTGKDNTTNIVIYSIVVLGIIFVVFFVFFAFAAILISR